MTVRKLWITFLLLLCLPVAALAQDEMPAEIQAMLEEYHGTGLSADYLTFELADGRRVGIAVTGGYSVEGFEYADGEWRYNLMTSVMDELRPAYLERISGDVPAFHLTKVDNTARLTYRFDGEVFRLVAWVIPGCRPVTVNGDTLRYGEGEDAFETVLPGGVTDWPWSADDLPLTPDEAMARAVIAEQNVAVMFPGYTLRSYTAYNDGTMAEAAYSRIDSSGILYIRRVTFEAGVEPTITDCIPVPLSDNLLARLETEPFDDLIYCRGYDRTFLTQDALFRESLSLPYDAVILDNQVQEHSVIALCEVDGVKYLYVWETDGLGYSVRRTQPLPEDSYLDLFHAGDGVVQFEWADQNMTASFARRTDGEWLLSWCTEYGPSMDLHFSTNAFGITHFDMDGNERMRIGTLEGCDLFSITLSDLNGASPDLDQSGWAVVSNPDPADRLHLRVSADKSSRSQGKFYNGTPVRVLGESGSWTKVQIGFGETACTGWMMTKYLAFGADMDKVDEAFPELTFRDEYEAENKLGVGCMVVGVEENGSPEQYILLGADGMVMYVPQGWLWGGNG